MIPRLFIDAPLGETASAPLSAEQGHYLKNVLRRKEGDSLFLFNGVDGEFAAEIVALNKKGALTAVGKRTRNQEAEPDLALYFAPVKRGPLEMIVQKAVELGAASLHPVITERTVATRVNIERLRSIATEAAEQCGRLSVPRLLQPEKIENVLRDWPASRRLLFCDEAGDDESQEWGGGKGRAAPLLETLKHGDVKSARWAILIGPEGGFTSGERRRLRDHAQVTPATLGPRILRADTAVIAALALWQAAIGDWRQR